MPWVVMGFEGTGKQWHPWQAREDLRHADSHTVQNGIVTGSFVANFVKNSSTIIKEYFAGPNIEGSNCDDIFRTAEYWFGGRSQLNDLKICLVGYSRGAYVAMCFAKYLKSLGRQVDFMGLFDPVSRDLSMQRWGTSVVESNVKSVRIAYRSKRIGSRRTSMNYAAEAYACGASTPRLECPGSHGAIGGFPNGAGVGDSPLPGQGDPVYPTKFHPKKEFTAWWMAGNHISVGAERCGVPVKRLVPSDGSKYCLHRDYWYSVPKTPTPPAKRLPNVNVH